MKIGREGSTDPVILLTEPFYLMVRTPFIGRRIWHLRFRFWFWHIELHLQRKLKCSCGEIVDEPWRETCRNGHNGENIWWHQAA